MNSRAGLISCRPWSSPGWPERQGSYLSYAFGVPAPGRHSWCGSPHTQALRPNASGRGLTRLGVIVSNATIWAKGDLPPLPTYHQGRPSQARL